MRARAAFLVASLAFIAPCICQTVPSDYLDAQACASCHRQIYDSYRRTAMGRSFSRVTPSGMDADFSRNNTYYHEASDQHFTMYQRDGRFFQHRHQIGRNGRETNVLEM